MATLPRRAYRAGRELLRTTRRVDALLRAQQMDPIDRYVFLADATREDGLFYAAYDEWRVKRFDKMLEIYGVDGFRDKRVLELGCGHGDIGAFLADLGADVLGVDGRIQNVNFGSLKYRKVKGLELRHLDLEQDFRSLGSFDLIVHFGLLYHLPQVETHLRWCFEMADDVLLETVVCDSTDPQTIFLVDENAAVNEEAVHGVGSRPSPFYVERVASEAGFDIERFFTSDLNVGKKFRYDWVHKDDNALGGWSQRRFWRFRRVVPPGP